ncbi:MAG TPA: cupin domain-containing protein [Actinomycetes bacterium]|nr:cupin domain-containing protein [Actinomycetes bacterium]
MTSVVERRAVGDRPALRRVLAETAEEFAASRWGVRPLLSTAQIPVPEHAVPWPASLGFDDLFSLEAADDLLAVYGVRTPFLRLARDGRVVPPARFTRSGGVGASVPDQVDADAVAREYAAGASVVFQALHRNWPPLVEFTARLTAEIGHPVQVNAYLTPPAAQGFSAHYDTHDVFVLQVAGAKHWTVHPPVLALPWPDEPWEGRREDVAARAAQPAYLDTRLVPGDSLYLPRGWLHSARAGQEPTLHLTVGVHPLTRRDLLDAAVERARQDPRLRVPLPLGLEPDDGRSLGGDLRVVADVLHGLAPDQDVVGEALARRRRRDTRPEPLRPVAQAAAVAALAPTSRVRLRAHLVRRDRGAHVELHLPDGVSAVRADDPAVARLLRGEPVTVADLPGEPGHVLALVRRLLAEAVLVPAD